MAARPVGRGISCTENPQDSYREFMLEFQDMQLAYAKGSPTATSATLFDPPPSPPDAHAPQPSAAFTLGQSTRRSNPVRAHDISHMADIFCELFKGSG